jgi:hypothetical protein
VQQNSNRGVIVQVQQSFYFSTESFYSFFKKMIRNEVLIPVATRVLSWKYFQLNVQVCISKSDPVELATRF